jgi:uncharacterized protein (DUF488 family)
MQHIGLAVAAWRQTVRGRGSDDAGRCGARTIGGRLAREMNRPAGRTVFTIGHSTRTLVDFVTLLRQSDVTMLVDVRSIPRSRTTPQFNGDTLPDSLVVAGIGYRHLPALGGRRHHHKDAPPSLNLYWRVAAFRNYADYAETDEFRAGLGGLRALVRNDRCAIMCAEAVWWRCYRRIITDYLLAGGAHVEHIMGPGQVVPATLTPGARMTADGTLRYSAPPDADPAADGSGPDVLPS